MSVPYRHLALTEVQPGMVLSDGLLDKQGQVLLAQGTVITEAIIALLPRHGIDTLAVLSTDQAAPAPLDRDAIVARLGHLFRQHQPDDNDDWASTLLRRYVEDYRLEREIAP